MLILLSLLLLPCASSCSSSSSRSSSSSNCSSSSSSNNSSSSATSSSILLVSRPPPNAAGWGCSHRISSSSSSSNDNISSSNSFARLYSCNHSPFMCISHFAVNHLLSQIQISMNRPMVYMSLGVGRSGTSINKTSNLQRMFVAEAKSGPTSPTPIALALTPLAGHFPFGGPIGQTPKLQHV